MAIVVNRDPRRYSTFWSYLDRDNNRYRHQVRMYEARPAREKGKHGTKTVDTWYIRTEVWEEGQYPPYYTIAIQVTPEQGKALFEMAKLWTNATGGEGATLYPPGYPNGFQKDNNGDSPGDK